ncbi:MAG: MoxR family ATPase [Cyanobacteria bacterium P01_D01_bin.50]
MVEAVIKEPQKPLEYTGEVQPKPGERRNGRLLYPYLPDKDLIEAVNLAIFLERPLLLKGEPGCGKTQLAHAVAYELNLPFENWCVKSTSRARDGLYIYDTVSRLRDAQLAAAGRLIKDNDIERINNAASYVQWGPLGRAFQKDKRTVVLIDEIDKADIDFPNDLLQELEELRFTVEETGQEIQAEASPIIFITSNDEKDLPDAFLRRCLFYYVKFPEPERLKSIIHAIFSNPESEPSSVLVETAVERFQQLREEMDRGGARKKVSTSELIDWFKVLRRHPEDEVLAQLNGKLPFVSVLLKSWDDHRRYLSK